MALSQQKLRSTLGLAMAAVMLAGCGHATASGPSASPTRPAGAPALGAEVAPTLAPDIRACAGVQALIGHMTVDTERWSPNFEPFDKAISARILLLSEDLAKEGPQAQTKRIQTAVQSNVRAFKAVAVAMTSKKRNEVIQTIGATKVAYRELKNVCALK